MKQIIIKTSNEMNTSKSETTKAKVLARLIQLGNNVEQITKTVNENWSAIYEMKKDKYSVNQFAKYISTCY